MPEPSAFRINTVVTWTLVGVVLVAAALTLLPFLPAILWGAILAIDLAPVHTWLTKLVGDRHRLAALLAAAFLALLLVLPAVAITYSLAHFVPDAIQWIGRVMGEGLPAPPAAILKVPAIGQQLYAGWLSLSQQGSALVAHFEAEIKGSVNWLLLETGILGTFVLEFVMAIVIAGILLAHQNAVTTLIRTFVQKTSGAPGLEKLALLVSTTRSVVRGVIGAAFVQAVVCTFAYVVAGVPGWPLLGALTCFASIIQIGPMLVWLPVAIWLWLQQATGWALFVGAWGLLVGNTVDNVVQPYLDEQREQSAHALDLH
jgi:predicted PurR-regulated permease PerM